MSDELPIPAMGLHALLYCERLFYFEQVEKVRRADERVYAGRALHAQFVPAEGEHQILELTSGALGLTGKLDAIRRLDGTWLPYEHKRGRARSTPDGGFEAWTADAVQVAAYGLLWLWGERWSAAEDGFRVL